MDSWPTIYGPKLPRAARTGVQASRSSARQRTDSTHLCRPDAHCGARLIERADMDWLPSAACTRGDVWTGLEAVCLFASARHIDAANKLIQEADEFHPAA